MNDRPDLMESRKEKENKVNKENKDNRENREKKEVSQFNKDAVLILGVETSCDETCAAVVRNGREILSNIIHSQIPVHEVYGGVVPEIASRNHIEKIDEVIQRALSEAGLDYSEITAIAVTYGPGLVGALLVGVAEAKALSYALDKPLVGVHHIEGHVSANYLENPELEPPFLCLVVSGGHTHLMEVLDYGHYRIIGRSRDDAAGEAFDKVARAVGLGYPGGPKIDKAAQSGNPGAIDFPRGKVEGHPYDFTFSGLKSSVLNYLNKHSLNKHSLNEPLLNGHSGHSLNDRSLNGCSFKMQLESESALLPDVSVSDLCASFQEAVTDSLVSRAIGYCKEKGIQKLAIAGGVSANTHIRARLKEECLKEGISLFYPSPLLCTDNAAMIASAGYYSYIQGRRDSLSLNACPNLEIAS